MRGFLFLVLASGLYAGAVAAVPVTWTLQGVTFIDGGTASGSFVYDRDTNSYSQVNITTTPGRQITTPAAYRFADPRSIDVNLMALTTTGDLTGTRVLELRFYPALSNSGGSAGLVTSSFEGTCSDYSCNFGFGYPARFINNVGGLNGTATIAPIPALSKWAALGAVLLLGASAFLMLRR